MYSHGPLIPMDLELKKFEVEDPSLNGNAAKDVDELNGCKINMKRHKQGQNWMRLHCTLRSFLIGDKVYLRVKSDRNISSG
jgi:hypothetical protein